MMSHDFLYLLLLGLVHRGPCRCCCRSAGLLTSAPADRLVTSFQILTGRLLSLETEKEEEVEEEQNPEEEKEEEPE